METLEELYSQEFEAMEMLQARRSFDACGGLEGLPQLIAAASSQEEVQRYIEVAAEACLDADAQTVEVCCAKRKGKPAPPGHKCTAVVNSCPYAAVQQIPRSQWEVRKVHGESDPDKARVELEKGITIKDPTGKSIHLGKQMLEHWKKDGHDTDRLKHLNLLKVLIRHPHEIWVDNDGARTYIAAYVDPYIPGSMYAIAFSTKDDALEINTFWYDSKQAGGKQAGTLIYAHR